MNETGRIFFVLDRKAYDGTHITIDISADAGITHTVREFRGFLLAAGYQPETVNEYVPEPGDVA